MANNHLLTQSRNHFSSLHPEQRIAVNGRDWGVLRLGNAGPKLLLLPGTLGRGDIFWQQMQALQGRVQIVALSYPGAGSLSDWADDIAEIVRQQSMQGAVILGSSMGGYLAQFLAATQPDLFSGLIAANTLAAVVGIDQAMPYSLDLATTPPRELAQIFATGLALWAKPDHPNAALGALLLQEVESRISGAELIARVQALKHAPALPAPALPKAQTFIIESGDDHLIVAPMRAQLCAALPARRTYHFATGSHFPYVTRPSEYTAVLEEVLQLAPMGTGPKVVL